MPASEAADLAQVAARLTASVREAGLLARSMFGTPINNWTKGESSPVSDADIAVDRLLHERLTGDGSGFAWLSEESVDDPARLAARYVWIVDPIDGTRAYLAGQTGLGGVGGIGRERPADRGVPLRPDDG